MAADVGEDIPLESSSLRVPPMNEVTRVLSAIEGGDSHAAEQLLPLVHEELRKLAAKKLAQEAPGQTLQATGLVHEAYLRLVDVEKAQHWDSRGRFFAAAAEAMRRILIENARRKQADKHGHGRGRVELKASDWFTCDLRAAASDRHGIAKRRKAPRPAWPHSSIGRGLFSRSSARSSAEGRV